jgi:hypothetical protein
MSGYLARGRIIRGWAKKQKNYKAMICDSLLEIVGD